MTTTFRRITISLPPVLDEIIREFAEIQGLPQSKVVIDLLNEFEPALRGLIKSQKESKAGQKEEAKRTLQHTFGDMFAEVLQQQIPPEKSKSKRGAKK